MIVADTDVLSYLFVPVARTPFSVKAFERDPDWIAPVNYRTELLNVLSKYVRLKKLSIEAAHASFVSSLRCCKPSKREPTPLALLTLSDELRITTYDAAFVWVAREFRVRLVTGDLPLVKAAPDVAVSVEDYADGR